MQTSSLPVGTVLKGRYRIARLVAGGGMAWIYQVEERLADGSVRLWALKELRVDADDNHTPEESRQLFEGEANILVQLDHPNLPEVSAFFQEGGRSYLVMEFVHGESLEKRLERANAPLLEIEVLDWALQICAVLSYLHTRPQPVIFRDMKPSNVMVTPEGRAVLIDFGIARTYKTGQRRDTISMGSENYAAPEQWGKAQTDARADIYGLGATMYHLLTNMPPLPAFVPTARVPLRQYNPAVSEATAAVVEKAMGEDRQLRFPTAAAMGQALLEAVPRRERRRIDARMQSLSRANGSQAAGLYTAPDPAAPDRAAPSAAAPRPAAPRPDLSRTATPRQEPDRRPTPAPPVSHSVAPERLAPQMPADSTPLAPPTANPAAVTQPPPAAQPAPDELVHPEAEGEFTRACPACGMLNRPAARFCRGCGQPFVAPLPPTLTLVMPPESHWEYPLRGRNVLIGRPGGAAPVDLDISFYDPEGFISRNHARVTVEQRQYRLTDLDSVNGTYVNGRRLMPHRPQPLSQGDRIRLGRVVLEFRIR